MMRWRQVCGFAAAALSLSGCWASTTRIEPVTDDHVRFEVGPPAPHLRRIDVSLREDAQGMTLIVMRQEMCETQELRSNQQRVHTKTEASPARWVPAAALAALGVGQAAFFEANYDEAEDEGERGAVYLGSAILLAGAVTIVAIPKLAERERTRLGPPTFRMVPTPARPCGQSPLANAQIALRTTGGSIEGVTNASGVARFDGLSFAKVRVMFVDNVAVEPQSAPSAGASAPP